MSKLAVLRKSADKRTTIPDFRAVVQRLRSLLQTYYESQGGNVEQHAIQGALMTAEHEWATQAVLTLYDHLTHHEQWRAAAYLVAYCVPILVQSDPRIQELRIHCLKIAEKLKDPETEQANFYLQRVHDVADQFMVDPRQLPTRGAHMLRAARLSRSQKVLEFATGCGSNVFHAALLYPETKWCGMDISKGQIDYCKEQAKRLGIGVEFEAHDFPGWYGKFDAVAVLDTLEHTAYPHELLEQAEKYIKPDGLVIFTLPNGPWSPFTNNKRNLELAGAGQHIAVESVATLTAMLQSRGKILSMEILGNGREPQHGNGIVAGVYERFED